MSAPGLALIEGAVGFALAMMGFGLLLGFVRLVIGPSLPDRVIALELMGTLSVGFIAALAIVMGEPAFLDAATVLALISFIGTVAFARWYLERQAREE